MKAIKSLVLEDRAELVANQLTQVIYFYTTYIFVFLVLRKSVVESSVYLDFITP